MLRISPKIILSSFLSVTAFVLPVVAQEAEPAFEAVPVAEDSSIRPDPPTVPARPQAPRRPASEDALVPIPEDGEVQSRENVEGGARGGSGGRTFVRGGRMMGEDFSYGTIITAPGEPGKRVRMRTIMRPVTDLVKVEISEEEQKEAQQLRELIKKLKETKEDDEEQRTALTKSIQAIFNTQFERDLKQREDALGPLEERVKSLRKQLDKRKSAKSEIIDLRLKMIVHEIDGLTFPGEEDNLDEFAAPQRRRVDNFWADSPSTYESNPDPFTEPRRRRSEAAPTFDPNNKPTPIDPQSRKGRN